MLRTFMTLASIFIRLSGLRLSANNGNGGYTPPSQPPQGASSGSSDTSTLAIATLILGISAWTFLPGIGGWAGMVTGWIELQNIKKGQSPESNKTLTMIGFGASAASVALQIVGGCIAGIAFLLWGAAFMSMIGLGAASGA